MRSLHVSDRIMGWDGYDDMPVAALPVEFRMPDIERYTGIGCPLDVSGGVRALRRGPDETVTSFISRWREKIAQIIDRPSRRSDQDDYRTFTPDFDSLVQALYGIEEGHRSSRCPLFEPLLGLAPIRPIGPTYLHPPPQGLVDLGVGCSHAPLPTHDTRVVPPPPEGTADPQAIQFDPGQDLWAPRVSPRYLQDVPPMTPFILFPEEYRPPHRDVRDSYGVEGAREVQRKDDEILRHHALLRLAYPFGVWPHPYTEMH
ncbi:hypothetical protein AAG906_015311 [Vitis piasezkii]